MDEAQKSRIAELDELGDFGQEEGLLDADEVRKDTGNNIMVFSFILIHTQFECN